MRFLIGLGCVEKAQSGVPHHLTMREMRLARGDLEQAGHQLRRGVVSDIPMRNDQGPAARIDEGAG